MQVVEALSARVIARETLDAELLQLATLKTTPPPPAAPRMPPAPLVSVLTAWTEVRFHMRVEPNPNPDPIHIPISDPNPIPDPCPIALIRSLALARVARLGMERGALSYEGMAWPEPAP